MEWTKVETTGTGPSARYFKKKEKKKRRKEKRELR